MKTLEFVSPAEAYEEAYVRMGDTKLQRRVDDYLGSQWPQGFANTKNPLAVFAPYMARGSMTEVQFLNMAEDAGFTPVVATYLGSTYVTANSEIVDCYKPPLKLPKGQQTRQWIVPEDQRPGEVGQADTIYPGLKIVPYWRGLRDIVLQENNLQTNRQIVDFGEWYRFQARRFGWQEGRGPKSSFYYMAAMAVYASGRAVLFDTPPGEFGARVMVPAANAAKNELGRKPLVLNEFEPSGRGWVDLSFLDSAEVASLQEKGSIR